LNKRAAWTETAGKALWFLCLGIGTILLLAGRDLRVPGIGLALTATAFFWRLSEPRRLRSLVKWMIPVLVFLGAYGVLLYLSSPTGSPPSPSAHPLVKVAHLFLRSVGMIFAVFALEEALRPLAIRARAGGLSSGRVALMLGLSYQLVPVFLQSLEGVALAQRAGAALWWLRPSCLMRAASSVFLLSHRLSEELALALSLRLRHGGTSETE
jgi:energy-coupling factor transporter transmembrane protein EcfT